MAVPSGLFGANGVRFQARQDLSMKLAEDDTKFGAL